MPFFRDKARERHFCRCLYVPTEAYKKNPHADAAANSKQCRMHTMAEKEAQHRPCPEGCGISVRITDRALSMHYKKCTVIRERQKRARKKQKRRRDAPADNLFRDAISQDVDFDAVRDDLAGIYDHDAATFQVSEQLRVIPSMASQRQQLITDEERAAAEWKSRIEQNAPRPQYFLHLDDSDLDYPGDGDDDSDKEDLQINPTPIAENVQAEGTSKTRLHPASADAASHHADPKPSAYDTMHDIPSIFHDRLVQDNPFDPESYNEDDIEHYPDNQGKTHTLTNIQKAQLDLFLLLRKSGCPMIVYDKVIGWLKRYTRSEKDIWTKYELKSRDVFLADLAVLYGTQKRRPALKDIPSPYDGRIISVPIFSFKEELMSMLNCSTLMKTENIAPGYDYFTGKMSGGEFWLDDTIDESSMLVVPVPSDPNRIISGTLCGTQFQKAVKMYCTKPHHMPVPLIFFYDEANLDFWGGLSSAPFLMSLAFFTPFVRARYFAWRVISFVPNLGIGRGRAQTKSAEDKTREHHFILREVLRELREICLAGGLKARVNGREVLLKIWVHYVIGDTKGHNELAGHTNNHKDALHPMRTCLCLNTKLSLLGKSRKCQPITLKNIQTRIENARIEHPHDEIKFIRSVRQSMSEINQRAVFPLAFDHLPMGNPTRGIHAMTPFESLHVFGQGFYKYIAVSINDYIGKNDTNKVAKEQVNDLFRIISAFLERQSERDFPRRSLRFYWTDGTRITATEAMGDIFVVVIMCHTGHGERLFTSQITNRKRSDDESQSPHRKPPTTTEIRRSLQDLLMYDKWVSQPNAAGEVCASQARVDQVLRAVVKTFERDGAGWDIPKFHGSALMPDQIMRLGEGSEWDSSGGESFHKTINKANARLTQKRYQTLSIQMATRQHENIIADTATAHPSNSNLLFSNYNDSSKVEGGNTGRVPTSRTSRMYTNPNLQRIESVSKVEGKYHLVIPGKPHRSGQVSCLVKWNNINKHALRTNLTGQLVYAIAGQAEASPWTWDGEIVVCGYTTMRKFDPTTLDHPIFRSDPTYKGREWRDWAIVDTFGENVSPSRKRVLCPGWILGFVQFVQPGFPTPRNIKLHKQGEDISCRVDMNIYAVVRAAENVIDIHKDFIKKFKLERERTYVLPMRDVVGPLCVVPNVNPVDVLNNRYKQDVDEFLIVAPQRMWGDYFGRSITWK